MMRNALLTIGLVFTVYGIALGQMSGTVFIDQNSNGLQDQGELVYVGAILSDGYHVVKTDKKGRFKLPGWEKQRFVTIYPSGDFDAIVRYIPIEGGKREYDFPLQLKEKKQEVSFVQISDTETFEYGDWVDNLKKYIKVHQPDFVVHTGDICYESGMKWHSENLTEKELGIPIYYCLGNHDLIKGERGESYFESKFGPAWYAFEAGEVVYVITPMMGGDYPPGFDHEDIGGWLKNLFEVYGDTKAKFFFNHDLLTSEEDFDFKVNEKEIINLNEHGLKAWFFGHLHMNMTKEHGDSGIRSFGTSSMPQGGIDHSPSSFREVKVDAEGNIDSRLRWTYLDREIQIVNPNKGFGLANKEGRLAFSVNVYDTGADVDSVRYSLWGSEGFNWTSSLDESKWSVMKQQSDWNWSVDVKLEKPGKYTLVIDAYLSSGEVIHRKSIFDAKFVDVPKQNNLSWFNMGGNPAHQKQVKDSIKAPYQLSWTANIGSNIYMSSPVLYGEYVMTSSFDDGNAENCFIVCWDANTGEERWRYQTLNGVKNQMVIAQGKLIATDMEGYTYAISISNGERIWKKDIGYNRKYGFVSGIVTDGENVYTGFSESLTALNVNTGEVLWKSDKNLGGYGSTATMTLAENVLIVNRQWGGMDAFDKLTGKHFWTRNDDGLRFRDGVVTYADENLWVAERENPEVSKLHQLSLKTGETLASFETGMQNTGTSSPVLLDDKIIIAGSHPGIAAFERNSGTKLWQFEVDQALFYTPSYFQNQEQSLESSPVLVNDQLIFGAMDGKVYAIDAHRGKLLWKNSLGAPVMTSPAVSPEGFYICDFAGNIYFFKSK
ncbi:PQQ-binding-like beta-propeller repeat protein [Echinicola sp. CAU 1574]|uniref:PQQ-binding-like beta-propeller repeat protein n=1 Tax=Echinicola arenosa TaxID=2774144 RepID=A0ABR9AME1_9BACT|nr:PQQ-binding-like beta-propeller repeat protein [Echinicola arenosa]MBD8489501.1 PQQ-binding-like beta-propeller repeat protein [Echinicola arenosa]